MISYNCYSVGDSLRELRKCHRLTQNEMAERLDISCTHYAQIEQGKHKMSVDLLSKMMSVLSADANSILGLVDEEKRSEDIKRRIVSDTITENEGLIDFICELSKYDLDRRNFILDMCNTFVAGYSCKDFRKVGW